MDSASSPLILGAASLGLVHTLIGPDHYLPFILVSRARGWGMARTLRLTVVCGAGHVGASALLGLFGVAAGLAIGRIDAVETLRGGVAAWLLFGSGLAYAAWGLRQALRDRPHEHWHEHADGQVHRHRHVHRGEHAHPHTAGAGAAAQSGRWGSWALFTLFVVGPCELLVPLLMVPAARGAWLDAGLTALAFALATVGTMVSAVAAGRLGLNRLLRAGSGGRRSSRLLERYGHVLTGLVLAACGAAMWAGA